MVISNLPVFRYNHPMYRNTTSKFVIHSWKLLNEVLVVGGSGLGPFAPAADTVVSDETESGGRCDVFVYVAAVAGRRELCTKNLL